MTSPFVLADVGKARAPVLIAAHVTQDGMGQTANIMVSGLAEM